ncbi:molybdenum cofactor biosynthesis protein B [Marinimicrobium sp. ABcell2]|uniref:molybdenum cofactor biosynthesis protein B n=1 Tax=Marinimicrobium sp. ABcell2 TaxID=3069751 RepID=UPI0027B36C9F|nr:molybdenum cofactor biosynthesis protein B [Marinimicrobium sp. ABcell2]MDQ2076064.1 molybdenum cofactor biosynthesis protein B [Marinimicrobium sp. ABcell2]
MSSSKQFTALNICVLTVSDTRTREQDTSGQKLQDMLETAGHTLYQRELIRDEVYQMRAVVSAWIADPKAQVVLITGGTGFSGRDSTPEAMAPLFDKTIVGFGELFRQISYEEIGTSTIQSRALAGLANRTLVFCLPGSTGACTTAWEKIISHQLDSRQGPCNFVGQLL